MKNYNDFIIDSTINDFIFENMNENVSITSDVKKAANGIADKISEKSEDLIDKVKAEYKDKSFQEIVRTTHKIIKNSAVGEFAGDVGAGILDKLRMVAKFIAKKTGEYSVIGLVIVAVLDYIAPFGMLDSFFGKVELRLGIAILLSLIIYVLMRKKK